MSRILVAILLMCVAACDSDMYSDTGACRDGDANTECPVDGSKDGANEQAIAVPRSQSTIAQLPSDVRELIDRAEAENERCQGASGHDPETLKACNRRYDVMVELEAGNWCWGGGEFAASDRWLRCSDDPNYRPGQLGSAPPFTEQDIQEAARLKTDRSR